MSSSVRAISSIYNQRSLGYATNKGIVSTLIPAEYMLNNSDRSVLSKSHFMIKCLLSYKVSFKFKKIEFTKKEIFKM